MRIADEDLSRHLAQGLAPLYVIHGEALLLAIEAADAIRAAARAAGYSEREVLIAEKGFNWAELRNSAQSLSLFSTRKLVDLRIPSGKPGRGRRAGRAGLLPTFKCRDDYPGVAATAG